MVDHGLATPKGPDSQTKSCQTEPDEKMLVLSGFLGQKFAGNLKKVVVD